MGAGHPEYDDNGQHVAPSWSHPGFDWNENRGAYLPNADGESLFLRIRTGLQGRGAGWLRARHDGDTRDNTHIFRLCDAVVKRRWFGRCR